MQKFGIRNAEFGIAIKVKARRLIPTRHFNYSLFIIHHSLFIKPKGRPMGAPTVESDKQAESY